MSAVTVLIRSICLLLPCLLALPAIAQDATRWYEVEAVNEGLARPVPGGIDRSTPRDTMESFVDAIARDDNAAAAHILDLSRIAIGEQAERGPELARKLGAVVERKLWIGWAGLSARPDALMENAAGNHPQAGQPRRNIELDTLDANGRAYALRLHRVKAGDADPVWLFTPQSVDNIDLLYATYGPRRFEQYIPVAFQERFWGLRLWEWLGLPLVGLVCFLIGLAVRRLLLGVAHRFDRPFVKATAQRAATPLALVAAAGSAQALLGWFVSFSGPISSVLSPLLIVVMVTGVAMAVLRVIDALLDRITRLYVGDIDDGQSRDDRHLYTSIYAVRRLVVLITVAVGVGLVLAQLNLFATLGLSLLASAGVLTVILGIAGQTVLGNILASLQIALAKPVRIGDSVMYEGDWAYVEAIFYTFIRLRTWDERRLIVPVKYFVSHPFENWSMQDASMVRTFTLVLDHMADVDVLRETFRKIAEADEHVIEPEELKVLVLGHAEPGMKVTFYAKAADPSAAWDMHARLQEAMLAFVRDEHPDWWPRERVLEADDGGSAPRQAFD